MCERCDAYADSLPATTSGQLDALLARASQAVSDGDLEVLDGDPVLLARSPGAPFPPTGRTRTGRWLCSGCSRLFLLEVHSREALGDTWRPLFGN